MMKLLRALTIAAGGLLALVAVLVLILSWRSPRDQYFDVKVESVPVPGDPEAVARGRYFAHGIAVCGVCHGDDLAGREMSNSRIWGYVFTPNLTSGEGGIGSEYQVEDWVRAIRHGVSKEGRGFAFMPVDHYFHITDEDLGDMIAYMQSLPPVDNGGARIELGVIPRALINSGVMGQELVRPILMDHGAGRPEPPATRGAYLALVGGCDFCHGPDLRGGQGPEPGAPPGPDITGTGIGDWSLGDFVAVMAAGRTPDGQQINPMYMPWQGYRHMNTEDLRLLFDHLRSLPGGNHGREDL